MKDRGSAVRSALILVGSVAAWLVAWAPFGLWSAMFAHAVRASRFLGRWPSYSQPDPKDLPRFLLDERIEAVVGYAVTIAAAAGSTYLTRRLPLLPRLVIVVAGIVSLWLAVFLLARLDPGGIVEWYVD